MGSLLVIRVADASAASWGHVRVRCLYMSGTLAGGDGKVNMTGPCMYLSIRGRYVEGPMLQTMVCAWQVHGEL